MHLNQKQQANSLYGEISVNVTLAGTKKKKRTCITGILNNIDFCYLTMKYIMLSSK